MGRGGEVKLPKSSVNWLVWGLPKPDAEYRFHPIRKWRFDWAWVDRKIAVEQEGGIWVQGAHVRGKHFLSDCEKYNTAQKMGWQVYRFTPQQINKGEAASFLMDLFQRKTPAAGQNPTTGGETSRGPFGSLNPSPVRRKARSPYGASSG